MSSLVNQALKLLSDGLLPADLSNVLIFAKIACFIALVAVLSGAVGFYLGLSTIKFTH